MQMRKKLPREKVNEVVRENNNWESVAYRVLGGRKKDSLRKKSTKFVLYSVTVQNESALLTLYDRKLV